MQYNGHPQRLRTRFNHTSSWSSPQNPRPTPGYVMPHATQREAIANLLEGASYTVKELSGLMRLKISDVVHHLEHVQRTYGKAFVVEPASCNACDFIFSKRAKLTCPSKCPQCRQQRVSGPWVGIELDE